MRPRTGDPTEFGRRHEERARPSGQARKMPPQDREPLVLSEEYGLFDAAWAKEGEHISRAKKIQEKTDNARKEKVRLDILKRKERFQRKIDLAERRNAVASVRDSADIAYDKEQRDRRDRKLANDGTRGNTNPGGVQGENPHHDVTAELGLWDSDTSHDGEYPVETSDNPRGGRMYAYVRSKYHNVRQRLSEMIVPRDMVSTQPRIQDIPDSETPESLLMKKQKNEED